MTLAEFKAWFEGYTEDLKGAPTEQQFARIKEKVKAIDGTPTTYPIFVDRWWPNPNPAPVWPHWSTMSGVAYSDGTSLVCNVAESGKTSGMSVGPDAGFDFVDFKRAPDLGAPFDSHAAMFALGKAEAKAA